MSEQNTLVITRTFDAPRNRVWKAWSDPAQMARWWGPKPFTAPVIKIDFRVGGKYLYCMQSPDGQNFWSTGTYEEIDVMEKIVCTDSFSDADGHVVPPTTYGEMFKDMPTECRITMTLEEVNGRTKMTLRHEGIPAGDMAAQCKAGWSSSFDKLEESML